MPTVVTEPSNTRCVTKDDVKAQARSVAGDLEDGLIDSYILLAEDRCENYTKRSIMPQKRKTVLPGFDCCYHKISANLSVLGIELFYTPVNSIESFEYVDADGVLSTGFDYTAYFTLYNINVHQTLLILKDGVTLPTVQTNNPEAVQIVANCGYEDAAHVPPSLKTGIIAAAAHMNKYREAERMLPKLVFDLWDRERTMRVRSYGN